MRLTPTSTIAPIAAALLLLGGGAAWWLMLDASPRPFLPEDAVAEQDEVEALFPAASPVVVRILVEAEAGRSVLSSDVVSSLAGLRNRLRSDPAIAGALARDNAIASVLPPIESRLSGAPGEWDAQDIASAIENATSISGERRALTVFLDEDAVLAGASSHARATVVVVELAATASASARRTAELRIADLAESIEGSGIAVSTLGPALATEAARSAWGLWVPLMAMLLTAGAGALVGMGRPFLVALAGGVGAGLLGAALAATATPHALVASCAGATVGLAAACARASRWMAVAVALPFAALARWPPSGLDGLALAGALGALVSAILMVLHAADPRPARLFSGLAAPPLVLSAGVLAILSATFAVGALPDHASDGWSHALPERTDAGRVERDLDEHFGGGRPGTAFTVAARGPVAEPGFLAALDEAAQRLEHVSLAAAGGSPTSVLSLARDWATDDRGQEAGDLYSERFRSTWENATLGATAPVRDAAALLFELRQLDPVGFDEVLLLDDANDPNQGGTALLLLRVSLPDVVPRPAAAFDAALTPLYAASEAVALGGNALDAERATTALDDALPAVVLVVLLATVAAAVAWVARGSGSLALGLVTATPAAAAVLAMAALFDLAGIATTPLTLLALPFAGAGACALAAPTALATATQLREQGDAGAAVRGHWTRAAAPLALVLPIAALAALTAPAGALRTGGLALLLGAALAVLATPVVLAGLLSEWARSPRVSSQAALPRSAHRVCPVCERRTATGASRCRGCGRWNLVEACPAHPDAAAATCAECGTSLDAPHFA